MRELPPKKVPLRRCCGCYEMKPKRELIRAVRSPEGDVTLDTTGKTPGRGAYLCHSAECLKKCAKKKGLNRAFKCTVPAQVYEALEEQLDE